MYGPSLYDLVSLTQDARINVSKKIEEYLVNLYSGKNKIKDKEFFYFCYDLIGIQRHLKVLGIFCRLSKRDKKDTYLKHLPRVKKMLLSNLMKKKFAKLNSIIEPLLNMDSINEAMIFAAGFGKRMLPLTKKTPKPLLKINNKSIISYQIERLIELNFKNILINGHHLFQQLESELEFYRPYVKIIYEKEILETGGGLLNLIKKGKI